MRQLRQQLETQLVQLKAHPLIPQRQHLAHQALLSSASSSSSGESASASVKSEFAKVGTTVLFDFDSAQLTDYAQRVLDRQAAFMKARPETRVIIGGHADERGTREYNLGFG